ncbi:MAG: TadE family protein [Novosphingobium sp.]
MTGRRSLADDQTGAAIVEFALIAPILLMTLFGLFDLGHGMYTKALLQGAIEKASRDSTIESVTTGVLDSKVSMVVRRIAPNAVLGFTRASYTSFSDIGQPEDFVDANSDSICDNGETFEDANGNGNWDAEQGRTGNGGARDAILYKVTVSYPRQFPIARFVGQSNTMQMSVTTVLRNQPYGLQSPPPTATCP